MQNGLKRYRGGIKTRAQTRANIFTCLLNHAYEALLANYRNGMAKVAKKSLLLGRTETQ